MTTVKDVLDEAVRDYNRTIFGKNSQFHERDSLLERRGIFYNSLRRHFQYNFSSFNFTNRIPVHCVRLSFRVDMSIEKFYFDINSSYRDNEEDVKILDELKRWSGREYLNTEVRINFDNIKSFSFKF